MKRFSAIASALVAGMLLSAGAANAYPTAAADVSLQPQGAMYKEVAKPVNATFSATITPAPGDTNMPALIESKTTVPQGLKFVPDPKMPTCSFTAAEANVPTDTALNMCPKALIGNGTSTLYIAQNVASKITDPRILIFNGKPDHGKGVLVMQGYSTSTNAGITFGGEISNGVLDVKVPRLTYDSSNPVYSLSIPGNAIPATSASAAVPKGLDPSFVQATCATGKWTSHASYILGDRDEAGNESNVSTLTTSPVSHPCKGSAGKAKFSFKVKGPKKVKSGKKGTFKVTVKNSGTGSNKKGKIKASGGGKGSAGLPSVKPGKSKTVKVKVKVTGKKGKKVTVKFKASGASGTGKAKVKVG